MDEVLPPLAAILGVFVALPWVVLHYITKWKTAATLTTGDEALLDDLYKLAKRLDERMDTVERLVAAEHPEFHAGIAQGLALPDREIDTQPLREFEQRRAMTQTQTQGYRR